jgi:hypothetical protein
MALGENGIGKDIDSPNYTLIPGCTFTDGTSYVGNDAEAVRCPKWIYDTIKTSKTKNRLTDAGEIVVELDQQQNIELAIDFLINDAEPAIEGQGGDINTFKTAAYLADIGISQELGVELMLEYYNPRCSPEWERDDLEIKMASAYKSKSLSKVGGKTAEADFADDPPPEIAPMGRWDAETTSWVLSPAKAENEKAERAAARKREAKKPTPPPNRARSKGQVLEQFVWIIYMKRFVNILDPVGKNERDIWDTKQFDSEFNKVWFPAPKKGSASDFLLRTKVGGPQTFYRVAFKPGQDQTLESGMTFNMYRQPDIVPDEGDIEWWNGHLEYLFPDEVYRNHLLNWMAWLLQNLDKKPKHALIIQGEVNGTGKSFIGKVLARILHEANVSVVPQNGLSGRFNSWALQCKLILIEELRAADKRAVKEALHDIITEDRINIEKKGVDQMMIDNCFGVMAFTNDDAALDLDNTDRRYLVIRTDRTEAEARARSDSGYFERLFAKLDDPAAMAAVAYSLMTRDLQGYSGQQPAPMTAAKAAMKVSSQSDLEHWLDDHRAQWPLSGRVVSIEDVITALPKRLETRGYKLHGTIKKYLVDQLRGRDIGTCTTPSGKRVRLYAINGSAAILSPQPRSVAGKLYEEDKAKADKGQPIDDLDADEEFGQAE